MEPSEAAGIAAATLASALFPKTCALATNRGSVNLKERLAQGLIEASEAKHLGRAIHLP